MDIFGHKGDDPCIYLINILSGHSLPIVIDVFMIDLLWVIFMTVVVILDILVGWT